MFSSCPCGVHQASSLSLLHVHPTESHPLNMITRSVFSLDHPRYIHWIFPLWNPARSQRAVCQKISQLILLTYKSVSSPMIKIPGYHMATNLAAQPRDPDFHKQPMLLLLHPSHHCHVFEMQIKWFLRFSFHSIPLSPQVSKSSSGFSISQHEIESSYHTLDFFQSFCSLPLLACFFLKPFIF